MTAQRRDSIIINNKEYSIYNYPLESYWKSIKKKPELSSFTTNLNRGYYAKWLIENKKLYIIDFYGESIIFINSENTTFKMAEYNLNDIFLNMEKKIWAQWFSGLITIPQGKIIDYQHSNKGAVFEYKTSLIIENGIVIDSGTFNLD
jgi:hypothetical protein